MISWWRRDCDHAIFWIFAKARLRCRWWGDGGVVEVLFTRLIVPNQMKALYIPCFDIYTATHPSQKGMIQGADIKKRRPMMRKRLLSKTETHKISANYDDLETRRQLKIELYSIIIFRFEMWLINMKANIICFRNLSEFDSIFV